MFRNPYCEAIRGASQIGCKVQEAAGKPRQDKALEGCVVGKGLERVTAEVAEKAV